MKTSRLFVVDYLFLPLSLIPFYLLEGTKDLVTYERLSIVSSFVLPLLTLGFQDFKSAHLGLSLNHLRYVLGILLFTTLLGLITKNILFMSSSIALWGYFRTYNLILVRSVGLHIVVLITSALLYFTILISLWHYTILALVACVIYLFIGYRSLELIQFRLKPVLIANQMAQLTAMTMVRFDVSAQLESFNIVELVVYKLQRLGSIALSHAFSNLRNGDKVGIYPVLSILLITTMTVVLLPLDMLWVLVMSSSKIVLNILAVKDIRNGTMKNALVRTLTYALILLIAFVLTQDLFIVALMSIGLLTFFYWLIKR